MKVRKFDSQHARFWMAAKDAIDEIEDIGLRLHTGAYSLILVATNGDPDKGEEDYVNCTLSLSSAGKDDPDYNKLAEILALELCREGRHKDFGEKTFLRYIENIDVHTLRRFQLMINTRLNMEGAV